MLEIKAASSNRFGFLSRSSRAVPVTVTSSIDSRTFTNLQSTYTQTLVSFTSSKNNNSSNGQGIEKTAGTLQTAEETQMNSFS